MFSKMLYTRKRSMVITFTAFIIIYYLKGILVPPCVERADKNICAQQTSLTDDCITHKFCDINCLVSCIMNDIKKLKDQQREKHPGFDSYLECMSRSLFTGLVGLCLGFSSFYFAQKLLQSKLPYPGKFNILISSAAACGIGYKVTSDRTKACQAAWMAVENKYTALSES